MSNVAVERALVLLRYIMDHEDGLSIREASRQLGYNPATVQKMVNSLSVQGFVVQDEITERYHLGPEAVQLGLIALDRLDVRRIARPYLETLNQKTGETVFLAIARGKHAVYVDKVVSNQPIRMDAPLGVDRPYNCTAVGKMLLSGMDEDNVRQLKNDGAFEKRTKNSVYEIEDLLNEIRDIRNRGWAIDNEEFAEGVLCLSAPIHNHENKMVAAITVSGPLDRLSQSKREILNEMKYTVEQVSKVLGLKNAA